MGKLQRRQQKRNGSRNSRRNSVDNIYSITNGEPFNMKEFAQVKGKTLSAMNSEQQTYINAIKNHDTTVCLGAAGSGKTFVPAALAGTELAAKRIERVILIRPNEPLGTSLGMLPGDLKEKLKPWLAPISEGLLYSMGKGFYEYCIENEKIEFVAVEHVRGRTFNDAYVIVDEAQNLSVEAIAAITTRQGTNCKMIICGDVAQKDIKKKSGLALLADITEEYERIPFSTVELKKCVRSETAAAFLSIYQEKGIM